MLYVVSMLRVEVDVLADTGNIGVHRHSRAHGDAHIRQECVRLALRGDIDSFASSDPVGREPQRRESTNSPRVLVLEALDLGGRPATARLPGFVEFPQSLVHSLPDCSGSCVAWIREGRHARDHLLVVDASKIRRREEDLSSDFNEIGWTPGIEGLGNRVDELSVVGDVLAGHAVSAGCHGREATVAVDDVDSKPVDLDFTQQVRKAPQTLFYALQPRGEFRLIEGVVQ